MSRTLRTIGVTTAGIVAVAGAAALVRRARSSGRISRTVELARLGGKAGADYVSYSARTALAAPDDKERLRSEFEMRTAEQVVETLGNMKGAVMKIGQMASYLDQGLPENVRAALAELQTQAPPMAPELAAEMVEAELGAPPHELFAEWEPVPIAAASIGQVHRAVTHDGQRVAVKVQYPGVDEAIRADLDNNDVLFGMLQFLFPGLDPGPIVEEMRERISEELDYGLEATTQQRFADYYRGHPTISVPSVLPELSAQRVMTSELVEGASFAEVRDWSESEKNLAAETLYRYAFGGIYRLHLFNGDPHPGNYLFQPGGRVAFLDYGLSKEFQPDETAMFERIITLMVLEPDVRAFARYHEQLGILGDADAFDDQAIYDYFSYFYKFVLNDKPMTVTPEYASEMVRRFFDLTGPHAELMKTANLTPTFVLLQRINLGLYALFAELGATANWRKIAEEIWPFVDGPPSTPMGEAIAEWESTR
jgi:predicted unusual protein kinase regulating ubiquinone biosynthesis (AarF/ABC1/UbiB family)